MTLEFKCNILIVNSIDRTFRGFVAKSTQPLLNVRFENGNKATMNV